MMLKKSIKKLFRQLELYSMDIYSFSNCTALFPPSFYATHTSEEILLAEEKEIRLLRKKINLL